MAPGFIRAKNSRPSALLGLREERHQHADHVAPRQHLFCGCELNTQLALGGGWERVALVVEKGAAEAAQPARQLSADLAEAEDAHGDAPQPTDVLPPDQL